MRISRVWAMVSKNTFDVLPIREFVNKYLMKSNISIDPFSRNSQITTYTNDLNPETNATYHIEARDFLRLLLFQKVIADLIILDPPYSQIQVSRVYQGVGREYKPFGDDNNAVLYREVRDLTHQLLSLDGVVLSFGWNSVGMGKKRGYKIDEILLVCHGGAHNDTICMAERRVCC
jgi:hypothetical protein